MLRVGKLRVQLTRPGWPPAWWGPFGATGWTPILYRVNLGPLHFTWDMWPPRQLPPPAVSAVTHHGEQ